MILIKAPTHEPGAHRQRGEKKWPATDDANDDELSSSAVGSQQCRMKLKLIC